MTIFPPKLPHRLAVLRGQDGITMIIAIGVMFVTSLLLAAAFTAANGEIHLSGSDTAQKKAYYAALAGVENYENHLTEDGNYLSYCTEPPSANAALNQVGETTHRAKILKENGEFNNEEYAIQLLPAESAPSNDRKCDSSNLVNTMLEEKSPGAVGTFRIESTGYSGKEERTIVATFRNANFVSFVWYTKFETGDPSIYGEVPKGLPSTYFTECGKFYGERPAEGGSPTRCRNNFFIYGESVNGPMHTEDHAGVCGSPIFGRNGNDRIEFGHAAGKPEDEGYSSEGLGCGATPVFTGKHLLPKEVLSIEPPPGDEELKHIVEKSYEYSGKTEIALEGSVMTVSQWELEPIKKEYVKKSVPNVAFPPNGVIYVTGGCTEAYSPFGPKPKYTEDVKCGNVYVHGEYTSSLTIASENDVIVNGNITTPHEASGAPNSNALLGLIANNFVRVYHPVEETYKGTGKNEETCKTNGKKVVEKYNSTLKACEYTEEASECDAPNALTLDMKEPTIYAAMLAVKHAVIVDNFNCGSATLGNLNIYGAVAGLFTNGFTGEFSGSTIVHGYPYDANYDNRLEVEEPPHFLNPIEASWSVQRETLAPNPSY